MKGTLQINLIELVQRSQMIQAKPMIEANATTSEPSDTNRPVQTNGDGKPMIVDRRYMRTSFAS